MFETSVLSSLVAILIPRHPTTMLTVSKPSAERWEVATTWREGGNPTVSREGIAVFFHLFDAVSALYLELSTHNSFLAY